MPTVEPQATAPPSGTLDDVMLAMDVVDTLRHREGLVERELNETVREEQLVERLRELYKSQGIEVPGRIIEEGVKGLKESRFVYTPPKPGLPRTLALIWVKRSVYGKRAAAAVAVMALAFGAYQFGVARPAERAAETARIELAEVLPRQLELAHQAVAAEAQTPAVRQRADTVRAQGSASLARGNAAEARAAVNELDSLASLLRQEYTMRIAGRPEDETGFFREHPSFQGRAYFVVVDAIGPRGNAVSIPVRNDETNVTETVSRFAVRVPMTTLDAVRADKTANGIVQNAVLAEKRRGYLDPEYKMVALTGRITRW